MGAYQYWLDRRWGDPKAGQRRIVFVMLNPSIGGSVADDPTIRRCVGFARREGFTELRLVNLDAFQTAYPAELRQVEDPVGPDNDRHLWDALEGQRAVGLPVVAAWVRPLAGVMALVWPMFSTLCPVSSGGAWD